MTNIEARVIEPTTENAQAVQRLTYDYYSAGNFPNLHRYANPENEKRVDFQRGQLERHPDNYTGVSIDGVLTGFIQIEPWTENHVLAFTTNDEHERLTTMRDAGLDILGPKKLAIATFAIDLERTGDLYEETAERLLDMATDTAIKQGKVALNGAFHEDDPLGVPARNNGFQFTGRAAVVPAHVGVLQRLYTKPLDY